MDLIRQLQDTPLSESERIIADYLLRNARLLPRMTTRQLAKETYTSPAAIVRFCQKFGFGGYTEFRVAFVSQMMKYIERPYDAELAMTDQDSVRSVFEKVTHLEMNAIQETYHRLDPADFARAFAILSKAEHIDFYAMDQNLDIANLSASGFVMANKCSSVHYSMATQYLQATGTPKGHVGFFISRTGENRMLIDICHVLHLRKTPILLITESKRSTMAGLSDVVFPVASVKLMEELGPRVFLMGAKYVMDILFAVLMTRVDYRSAKSKEKWLGENFRY